ncbi:MAG: ABC transporter substrate-binding protein [Candidatus Dadabacteria bacterium]|nr:ABC transporter substrate-binding protein [Candidatus Dadabacteria bacterium]MDE0662749.1 ABC transporter substrate-binding protein [Candidatus Dadabacteria bacterium]
MRLLSRLSLKKLVAASVVAILASAASGEAREQIRAEPGVYSDRIVFGQSAAFSGPASELGKGMQTGILSAFKEVNDRGGVNGRRLELRSLDDAYEPEAAIVNTQKLIGENVFALIGAVGTPTSKAAVPVAEKNDVPYIAPMTGAEYLRGSKRRTVINLRASYYQETEEMIERLTTDLGINRIAILHQDDSFGRAGLQGVLLALERRTLSAVGTGIFPRNTVAIKTALVDLRATGPEAVIIVGPYKPTATFIKWAHHIGLNSIFMTLSFVGSNALASELGDQGAGVLVTQVVPFPTGNTVPASASYRAALKAYDPAAKPGFISYEGYLAGRLVVHVVENCGRQVTRSCIDAVLRTGNNINLDGFTLRYSKNDNQGSDSVFLTMIGSDGQYTPLVSLTSATILTDIVHMQKTPR